MTTKLLISIVACLAVAGCLKTEQPKNVIAQVNDYQITQEEFERGYKQSPFFLRDDKAKARKEYLDDMINHKLILQDAQKRNIDKDKDFLASIERFWEQSLMTITLSRKSREIAESVRVSDEAVRQIYNEMMRAGRATRTYEEMYPQISWQAKKQVENQKINEWVSDLRKNAAIKINTSLINAVK